MAGIGGGPFVPSKTRGFAGGISPYGPKGSGGGTSTEPTIPSFDDVFGGGSKSANAGQGGGMGYMNQDNPYSRSLQKKSAGSGKGGGGGTGGAGGGGAGGTGGTGGTGGPISNTTQISPYLQSQIDRYESRFDVDNTKRAIDKSTLGVMDAAALGARDLGAANAARRGISGTGTSAAFLAKRFYEPAQRQAASNAADIAMGRERELDALTLGGTSLMRSPDDISLANRDLALRQALGYEGIGVQKSGLDLQRAQAEQAIRDNQISQYLALINMMMPS